MQKRRVRKPVKAMAVFPFVRGGRGVRERSEKAALDGESGIEAPTSVFGRWPTQEVASVRAWRDDSGA